MPQCAFKSCKNNYRKKNLSHGTSYFRFPGDPVRFAEWVSIVANERKDDNYTAKKNSVICSLHFDAKDILGNADRHRLSKAAVPIYQILPQDEDMKAITEIEQTTSNLEENCNGENIQSVSPPIQLSVEVEVEKLDADAYKIHNSCTTINSISGSSEQDVDDTNMIEINEKCPEKLPRTINEKVFYIRKIIPQEITKEKNNTIVRQYTLTTETIMKAIEEQSKENTEESDKCLDIICKCLHVQSRNVTLSYYDEEVNKALKFWSDWYSLSPFLRSTPLMYKCYICLKGWWRLHPFKEHLKKHSGLNLKLKSEPIQHELNIFVSLKQVYSTENVEMVSNCWKCGRDAAFHKHGNSPPMYVCAGCNKLLVTCTRLKEHESMCLRNIKLTCEKYNVDVSKGKTCTVCSVYCVNQEILDAHMMDYHLVRSDEPVILDAKGCLRCGGRYFLHKFHECPAKLRPYECDLCYKSFSSLIFLHIHKELSKSHIFTCTVCGISLSQCLAPSHYLKHSKNYLLFYTCRKCDMNLLYTNEATCATHIKSHNKRAPAGRMMLPMKCFNGEIIKSETLFSVPDESLVNFMIGSKKLPSLKDTETTSQIKGIQAHTLTTPNIAVDVVDDDIIILDDDDDVEPLVETVEKSESLVEKDYDIGAMQAQLDEEIMRELEAEEYLCKAFQSSKSFRLLMEREALEKTSEENKLTNKESKAKYKIEKKPLEKKAQENILINGEVKMNNITEKESSKVELFDKGCAKEFISEETVRNELIGALEDESMCGDDLIFIDNGVEDITTISDSESEETLPNSTYGIESENKELDSDDNVKVCLQNDIKKEKYLKLNDIMEYCSNNSDQDLDWNSSAEIKVEEIESENLLSEEKVKLDPSAYEEANEAEMIVGDQSIKTKIDVNIESNSHKCKRCGFSGEWRRYIVHVSTGCPGMEFTCNLCVPFSSIRDFFKHLTEHDYKPLSCPECHIQTRSFKELRRHVVSHILSLFTGVRISSSQESSLYNCKKCGICVQAEWFFKHWQTHVKGLCYTEGDYSSESCAGEDDEEGTVMNSEIIAETLNILQKNAERGQVKQCIVCYKIIQRWSELKRHLIEHLLRHAINHREGEKTIKCYFCKKNFAKVYDWKYHMREHSHLHIYKCPLCTKCFSDSSNFCKHKKVHNLASYICDLCGGKYQTRRCLIQHLKLHENSLSCAICGRTFVSESTLKRHMTFKHDANIARGRLFSCPMCTKRFKIWRDREEHLWMKHGHRKVPADCPLCDMGFRTPAMVKRHMRLKHNATFKITFSNE